MADSPHSQREIVARFDRGAITSDGGRLLLREVGSGRWSAGSSLGTSPATGTRPWSNTRLSTLPPRDCACLLPAAAHLLRGVPAVRRIEACCDASACAVDELERIVGQIRRAWPDVIVLSN